MIIILGDWIIIIIIILGDLIKLISWGDNNDNNNDNKFRWLGNNKF